MGMMLRRGNRKPDYAPKVNGEPIKKEPKNRSLTPETTNKTTVNTTNTYTQSK